MNLVVDIGNSFSKIAILKGDEVVFAEKVKAVVSEKKLLTIINKYSIEQGILSSVVSKVDEVSNFLNNKLNLFIKLTSVSNLPIDINYKTPKTLGNDRIALAVFGSTVFPKKNVLIIDAGTCVTYEFVSSVYGYQGGAISPGLTMRFKSLNNFTSNLPLLEIDEFDELIGSTTNESIWSGVQNGIINEIDGVINEYNSRFKDLKVIITGGDQKFLQSRLKSNTFAHPNALIKGLNNILNYNAKQ